MVLVIFLGSLLGTGMELFFLDHTQGFDQLIPIVLMVMSLLILAWHALERKSASLQAFRITMLLMVASGILGAVLHYRVNAEFERETDPNIKGTQLLSKVLTGAAPALAPGTMIQLGLLGLVYTFRHPVFGTISREHI